MIICINIFFLVSGWEPTRSLNKSRKFTRGLQFSLQLFYVLILITEICFTPYDKN